MPKSLDLTRLKQFEAPQEGRALPDVLPTVTSERWPSREPQRDGQVSIKAPHEVIERFRRLCKEDRRTYADMLSILMDRYERKV